LLPRTDTLIDLALEEDAGFGDITSQSIFPVGHSSRAQIVAREQLVVCGLEIARRVFKRYDSSIKIDSAAYDGDRLGKGQTVMVLVGPTISLLTAERTALNFLQRLSGIASLSRRFADAATVADSAVRVVDTRKTTPGWRALEKYAVRCGNCFNHRSSLGEHILIKDNHIAAAGCIHEAVKRTRALAPHTAKIEIEAASMDEIRQALDAGVEVIMLDNMSPSQILEAVALIDKAAIVEVSGGVSLESFAQYALPGVDVISVGALTHSAPAADLSMTISAQQEA